MLWAIILIVTLFGLSFAPFWLPGAVYLVTRSTRSRDQYTQLVVELLQMGKDWTFTEARAIHPCGVNLWVSGGRDHIRYADTNRSISGFDQNRIWHAYTKMRAGRASPDTVKLAAEITKRYADPQ